jgi:phosphoribosylglycinamide formyltransferase-1
MTARIAVLASGAGTNLQAILDYLDTVGERRAGEVVLVASDRPDTGALARATARGVPTGVIGPDGQRTRARALEALLRSHGVDLIALAGYLDLVPAETVDRYRGRIVNVHPALLPAFGGRGMYGLRVHQAVLDAGSTVSGVTIHFVDESYDRGPIIAQWPVPVLPGDTAASLAARVLRVEHILYPLALNEVAAGRVALGPDGGVRRQVAAALGRPASNADEWVFCPSSEADPRLASQIARAMGV